MQAHIREAGEPIIPLDFDGVTSEDLSKYLGVQVRDRKGNIFVLVKGVANGADGAVVKVDSAGVTALLTAANADADVQTMVMCAAIDATTKYGFASPKYEADSAAKFGVLVDANTAAGALLHTGATAGQLASGGTIAGHRPVREIILDTAQGGSAGKNTTASWNMLRTTT